MKKDELILHPWRWRGKKMLVMKLVMLMVLLPVFAFAMPTYSQKQIKMEVQDVSLEQVLKELHAQSGYYILYNKQDVQGVKNVSLKVNGASVDEVLKLCLRNTSLQYEIEDQTILISVKKVNNEPEKKESVVLKGVVKDSKGGVLPGVTVMIKGTSVGTATDMDGNYSMNILKQDTVTLIFSFVGMKTKEVEWAGQSELNITLEDEVSEMDEVVVTGIFQRKKESFTGSTATFKKEELKMVGTQNLIQSLKTLDPSFVIMENNDYGSDPNRLPDIEIRGKSSVVGLKEQYDTDPNQPLFILDGFETDLQTVVNLNMDRVQSVTILKDAASTALYGSKAANGVVVIETKQPEPGTFRVSYNGNFSLSIPDLSDYNLMNAREKLEFEQKAGFYKSDYTYDAQEQLFLDSLYNLHRANVARGVNTYWLSEPLRVALVHKHNIYAEGGDNAVRYGLGVTYNGTDGVMKNSGNDVIGMNFDLNYRKGKFRFFNKMSFDYTKKENPTVSFSEYAKANPYFEKYDENGNVTRYLEEYYTVNQQHYTVENPLYNASLNSYDRQKGTSFINKFNAEYRPVEEVMVRGRISLEKKSEKAEYFLSPEHTSFDEVARTQRGSYKSTDYDTWIYDGELTVTYGKLFNDVHQLNAVLGANFRSSELKTEAFEAVGFPVGDFTRPSFATSFPNGGKPDYTETVTRSNSWYLNMGYAFDNRYLFDANIRLDGASVFGSNKRYTETWSVGAAWNIHNENFLKNAEWMTLLKVRASIGNPGNQNFDAYQSYTTYSFNNWSSNDFGTSLLVDAFGNPDLKWQKTLDMNVGADIALLRNRFNINFDYYQKRTDPLLAVISLPSSVGTKTIATNIGEQWNTGYSATVKYSPIYRPEEGINWNLSLNFRHQKSEYRNIGNSLSQFNAQNENTSLVRYYDGGSPTALWAVRSLGIDPANGKEVFLKKDGTYTYTYETKDEVQVGDTEPDLEGVIGTTLYYKGFSFSAHLRYSLGGDVFNEALYTKVENISEDNLKYNQDKRALYDRWEKPGQHARFKGISLTETTQMSSRFVQRSNFLKGESFSAGYDFPKEWIEKAGFSALRLQVNMNDVFRISSVKEERGIEYPFARMVSASVSVTF